MFTRLLPLVLCLPLAACRGMDLTPEAVGARVALAGSVVRDSIPTAPAELSDRLEAIAQAADVLAGALRGGNQSMAEVVQAQVFRLCDEVLADEDVSSDVKLAVVGLKTAIRLALYSDPAPAAVAEQHPPAP